MMGETISHVIALGVSTAPMHSASKRFNALTAFTMSTLMALAAFMAAVTLIQSPSATAVISINNVRVLNARDNFSRQTNQAAIFEFDLDADLQNLFSWNTHMVFVYLSVEYSTPDYAKNELLLWDRRILSRAGGRVFSLRNERSMYPLFDVSNGLLGANATFSLRWNIIPYAGFLFDSVAGQTSVVLPVTIG